jgi:hypothetical protein
MKVATKDKIMISISSLNFKGATNNQKIFAFSGEKTRIMSCLLLAPNILKFE